MELGSEKDCVAVVVTKVRAVETKLEKEVHKEEKNMSRNADIAAVEKQNNSIIHDVINEAEEKNMGNITSKIGDIKEGLSNDTAQLEEVFKGKIKELNATIQSFKEEPTPKSEAVIGLPIVNNWPDSERVEYDRGKKDDWDEEESIFQTSDLRDDPEFTDKTKSATPSTSLRGTEQRKDSREKSLKEPPDYTNRINTEIAGTSHTEVFSGKPSHQHKENSSTPADFASLFEEAPLWIPENATNAYESTPLENQEKLDGITISTTNTPNAVSNPSSVYPVTLKPSSNLIDTSTSDSLNLLTNISGENLESATLTSVQFISNTTTTLPSTIQVSSSTSNVPTSVGFPLTPSRSTNAIDKSANTEDPTLPLIDSATSSGNLNQSTAASSTFSYPWERGSCDAGQVECREGGCIRKVNE